MQAFNKKTIGRKRKLIEMDTDNKDEPVSKRLKAAVPKAMDMNGTKTELFERYHTKFPSTFVKFWEFIISITKPNQNPLNAFNCLNLRLVSPFEYVHGSLNTLSNDQILTHYRYYFDLPEFQTIMVELNCDSSNVHYGYWRDDPSNDPIGICKSNGNTKVTHTKLMIEPVASNLFYFVKHMIGIADNSDETQFILTELNKFTKKNKIKLNEKNKLFSFKERQKKVVTKTVHGFGLVVPLVNDIGYRPIGYSVREMRSFMKRMNSEKIKKKEINAAEMECILTNVCLADDEGDPGMGYELGINCFYSYRMFQNQAKRLLGNAYQLTNRDGFQQILNAHWKVRDAKNPIYNQLLNTNTNRNSNNKPKITKQKQKNKITNFFVKKKKKVVESKKTLDDLSSDSD